MKPNRLLLVVPFLFGSVIVAPPGHEDPSGNPPGSLATDLENPGVDRISDAQR
jgi:hypothetical protein